MAEDRKARYALEKRAKAYKEFHEYAIRLIANEVIRSGFTNLGGIIEQILQMYRQHQKDYPLD